MRYGFFILFGSIASLCLGIESCPDHKTPVLLRDESIHLLDEQQHVLAQERFLSAIEGLPKQTDNIESVQEKEIFDSFLVEYEKSFQSFERTEELQGRVQKALSEHPQYLSLLYFVAACQANLGQLREFFDAFFQAVSSRPTCFMSSKIIGVLHLRLSESLSDESKRLKHRKAAIEALKLAFKKEPRDISLLIKLTYILPESEKFDLVREVCSDVVLHDKAMRREDCLYIIGLAMSLSLYEEAKLLVDKAHTWYEYSRTLNRMSDELEQVSPAKKTGND